MRGLRLQEDDLITAAAPQETAVGVVYAGQSLSLAVALRGSAVLSPTAVASEHSSSEVELKALPAYGIVTENTSMLRKYCTLLQKINVDRRI